MSTLKVTLIDVGWGDSLLLEAVSDAGDRRFALIDSNDTSTLRSSHIYLKRFFERQNVDIDSAGPVFDWVLLTHAHADHGQGLKRLLKDYGTDQFWYPKSNTSAIFFSDLLNYAHRSTRVRHHQSIDSTKILPDFGDVKLDILWPPRNFEYSNENNNSVVLSLTLGDVAFMLTGDLEAEEWSHLASDIPENTAMFKVPHHGSQDALFDDDRTPWLDRIDGSARLAISSHIRPFSHPDLRVINELERRGETYYRTDQDYHIVFETDGEQVSVQYSHV